MKCLNCDNFVCREFYARNEKWRGFCMIKKHKVCGDDECDIKEKTANLAANGLSL